MKKLVKTYVKRVATRYARTNLTFFSLNSDDHKFFFSVKFSFRFSLFSAKLNLAFAPSCHFAILQIQFFLFKRLRACRYKNSSKKLWWCSRYGLAFSDACSTFNKNRSTGCKKTQHRFSFGSASTFQHLSFTYFFPSLPTYVPDSNNLFILCKPTYIKLH